MDTQEFCSRYAVERRGSNCLKWDSLQEIFGDADLTALWVADMEFKTADSVREALQKRVEHGAFGYGKVPDSYFEAFAAWQKDHHELTVKPEELRFFTGVVPALYALVNAFTKPGEAILISTPVYYPFYDAVLNTGRQLVTSELVNEGGRYVVDFETFERAIEANDVKAFILCSPHNPISRVWTLQELTQMLEICRRHDVLVISDEIHADFVHEGHRFLSAASVEDGAYKDRLIVLNSASKTFNLAGVILSHTLLFDSQLRETYDAYIKTQGQPEANAFGLVACEAAYRGGAEWLENVKAVIWENYSYLKAAFAEKAPRIVVTPLEGTYLVWVDLRQYCDPEKTAEFITKKCRLAVDVGEWFSLESKGFIRLNLATHPKYIQTAVTNILNNL